MKLILGVILSLALLELFHCAPLIGSDNGTFTEKHTSSKWGFNTGLDANIGLEGGFKDGVASLGAKKHLGFNVGGYKENDQQDLKHAVPVAPPPNNFGSGYSYPYGMPNIPVNGSPYAPQPAPQYPPQFAQQPFQQYPPQQPQVGPQYTQGWPQYAPQYVPQGTPQYAPQYVPQGTPQYAPQYVPQGTPQYAPQYVPQGTPQYAPQGDPQYAPQGSLPYGPTKWSSEQFAETDE